MQASVGGIVQNSKGDYFNCFGAYKGACGSIYAKRTYAL